MECSITANNEIKLSILKIKHLQNGINGIR